VFTKNVLEFRILNKKWPCTVRMLDGRFLFEILKNCCYYQFDFMCHTFFFVLFLLETNVLTTWKVNFRRVLAVLQFWIKKSLPDSQTPQKYTLPTITWRHLTAKRPFFAVIRTSLYPISNPYYKFHNHVGTEWIRGT
jgi:hypothetical protein